ncbi:MAG: hypothetical protein ACR2MQ_10585 [Gemmatimonadaceae bacterium]
MNLNRWRLRRGAVALAGILLAGAGVTACTEKLDGSAACPLTCTDATAQIQTVTLDAVASSATVPGGLGKGTEQRMLLSSRGDTLDTRVIIRFDSLPTRSRANASDTTTTLINVADSVYLKLHVDSSAARANVPVTLSIYDVDTPEQNDTAASVLQPLFVPSRLIVSQQFAAGALADSVSIRLPNSVVLAKARAGQRLRLGLQIGATGSISLRVASSEAPLIGPALSLRTSADTSVAKVVLTPYSATPTDNRSIAQSLGDFTLVVKGTPVPSAGLLAVGGLPSTRGYLRFNIPSRIVDSSLVIRATLLLTQRASGAPNPTDTMLVRPLLVFAGPSVTDPAKAAQITADSSQFAPLATLPGTSGVREVEIAPAFRFWSAQSDALLPRAITLKGSQEEFSPQQALFYSATASDPTLRPKLRISYTFRARIGIP